MKNKSSHSSLDEFILEQIEGTKILHLLFNRIHKITKDTNTKDISKIGAKFSKELYKDCKNFEKVLYEIEKMLDQFLQNPY